MKVFNCSNCGHEIYFQNHLCVSCGSTLAYVPELRDMRALVPAEEGRWRAVSGEISVPGTDRLVLCQNYTEHNVCNWAITPDDSLPFCRSCRQTEVVPNLAVAENQVAWGKLELAKRRLIHSLLELGLPVVNREEDPEYGIGYRFLSDADEADGEAVLTGHADGLITLNIAEADDLERERRRHSLHEPYRTLLGHFRHEVGHYYWRLLMRDRALLRRFRKQFGDERKSYARALKHHYTDGPQHGWQSHYISAYASSHPWEDWAETWAHYLHMIDALDTAASSGVTIHAPSGPPGRVVQHQRSRDPEDQFDIMIADWLALACALNNLSRSLGLLDAYPFVLAPAVIEKLRFIHDCVGPKTEPLLGLWI